jgi:hypothetical protein
MKKMKGYEMFDLYLAPMQMQLPNTPSLVRQVFHHQMVPFEFDAALNIIAITSTNAISLTIGTF